MAERFAGQWLGVNKLHTSAQPDPNRFKDYSVELRNDMVREPIEFFHHLVREDRSLLELIDADYTFANARLARHYGYAKVTTDQFHHVSLTNRNRGGVLGMSRDPHPR